jgi:5'-3' exonuclease
MNYLLVDTSYLTFYRYFATKLWYRRAQEYTDDQTMVTDPIFTEMFTKKTIDCLEKLVKTHNIPWDNVILARDCPRNDIWRLQLLPSYKGTRIDQVNCRSSFYQIRHIIVDLIRSHNVKSIGVAHAEADDVVAVCHGHLMESNPDNHCYILASDTDYYQLINDHTRLIRLDHHDPMKNFSGDAKQELLAKIIGGDVSDCIPKCLPKCGKKTALHLASSPDLLTQRLQADDNASQQFQLNQRLIDFQQIPSEICELILIKFMVCLGEM